MSNPIPPLLCSTPPPIDDDDHKTLDNYDDDEDNNGDCDSFDKFESVTNETNEGLSLPSTPRHSNENYNEPVTLESASNNIVRDEELENKFEEMNIIDEKISIANDITKTNSLAESSNGLNIDLNLNLNSISNKSLIPEDLPSIWSETKSTDMEETENELHFNELHLNESVSKLEIHVKSLNLNQEDNESNTSSKIQKCCDENKDLSQSEIFEKFNKFNAESNEYENENNQSPVQEIIDSETKNLSGNKHNFDSDFANNLNSKNPNTINESKLIWNQSLLNTPNEVDIPFKEIENIKAKESLTTKNSMDENRLLNTENCIESISFEADFSQFESCDSPIPKTEPMSINRNIESLDKANFVEDDGYDDDFDNFQHFDSSPPKSSQNEASKCEDDFGEFTTSLPPPPLQQNFSHTTTNNEAVIEKVTTVLTNLFPIIDEDKDEENTRKLEKISLNLNAVERAYCLDFLYNKSNIKSSLIKSLGIDTRNILYGENWSSGIPRFAANLGFSPLEPIKPVAIDSASMCNNSISKLEAQSQNPTKENHQCNWSETSMESSSTASQAHTLLLDLDQLMVMANVDNIKIDSSSSPCSSKYYDTSTKSTTNYLIFDSTQINDSDIGGGECCDDISTNKYEYDNYLFDHYLDSRIEEALSKGKIETVLKKESDESNHSIEKSTISYEKSSIISTSNSNIITESEPHKIVKNNEYADTSNNAHTTTSLPVIINNDLNINFFVSSASEQLESLEKHDERQILEQHKKVPFHINSATTFMVPLKETHIFTPSKTDKPISQTTNDIIDFEIAAAAAGTIIDETVIKKEYHDIEYEPKKLSMPNISPSVENITFEQKNKIIQSFDSIIPVEKLAENSMQSSWEEEFSSNNAKKKIISTTSVRDSEKNGSSFYHINSEFKNTASQLNDLGSSSKFSEPKCYLENSSISPDNLNTIFTNKNINQERKLEFPPEMNEAHKNLNIKSELKNCDSFDDEFSDFQSVPPTNVINSMQSMTNDKLNNIKSSLPNSRTNTPTNMILSPAVLLPQSVRIEKREPKIEWPDPGINTDELARIETLYPQKAPSFSEHNQKDNVSIVPDDDWSDFVSVPPPPSTQSSLNTIYCPKSPTKVSTGVMRKPQNYSAFDDDDWSDFVSSTPTSQQKSVNINLTVNSQQNYNHIGAIKNVSNCQNTSKISNLQKFSTSTSQQCTSQNFVPTIPNDLKSNFIANNKNNLVNNKMSQYLLNNSSSNEPKKFVQMNTSLKPIDFIPNHHQQTFNNQFKNINNHSNSNNIKTKSNNSVSLIPNLGFIAPIQNFNSTKSRNQQFIQKK